MPGRGREVDVQVTTELDAVRERVTLRVPAGTRWAAFEAATMALLEARPETADWHWLIDDAGPIEDIDVSATGRIAAAFRRHVRDPGRRPLTVIITRDPYFAEFARVIDLHFDGRRHVAAPTVEAAEALLDRLDARPATGEG